MILPAETTASVLRLMKFSGVLKDRMGNPRSGVVGLTFALYHDQQGGAPLWLEVHNAQLDEQGRYTVLLGSTRSEGLPLELFSSGEARWLGVQAQLPGEEEQARVLLVSVPYAMKAADAETLGGKPPSAFVLAEGAGSRKASEKSEADVSKEGVKETPRREFVISGTTNFLAKFTGPNPDDLGDSALFESGGAVGIGTSTPATKLHVFDAGSASIAADAPVTSNVQFRLLKDGSLKWAMYSPNSSNDLRFFDTADRLTLQGGGNVGIGTTTPGRLLHLSRGDTGIAGVQITTNGNNWFIDHRGSNESPTNRLAIFSNPGAEVFSILQTGAVGIGTSTPATKLHVFDAGSASIAADAPVTGNVQFRLLKDGSLKWAMYSPNSSNDLRFFDTADRLTLRGGGNVGIGTASPAEKLEVAGNVKVNGGGNGIIFPDSTVQMTAGGDITAVNPGTGLTGGGLAGDVTLSLSAASRVRGITYLAGCDSCGALVDGDDQKTIYQNVIGAMTINSVTCFSDTGSPVINLQRDDGTPANILSANLTCSTAGASTTTFVGGESVLNLNDKVDFVMVTATGSTAKRVTVVIKATVN